jgi:hypothetical protein
MGDLNRWLQLFSLKILTRLTVVLEMSFTELTTAANRKDCGARTRVAPPEAIIKDYDL